MSTMPLRIDSTFFLGTLHRDESVVKNDFAFSRDSNLDVWLSSIIRRQVSREWVNTSDETVSVLGSGWNSLAGEVPTTQAYFWTPEWQEGEREAEDDLRSGRVFSFGTVEEALEWLDSDSDL